MKPEDTVSKTVCAAAKVLGAAALTTAVGKPVEVTLYHRGYISGVDVESQINTILKNLGYDGAHLIVRNGKTFTIEAYGTASRDTPGTNWAPEGELLH